MSMSIAYTTNNHFALTGKLIAVGPVQQKREKFSVREFVIDHSYSDRGNDFIQFGKFQLHNHQCDLIDFHKLGSKVKVHFRLTGSLMASGDYFTNLQAYRIETIQEALPAAAPAPQPAQPQPEQQWRRGTQAAPAPVGWDD